MNITNAGKRGYNPTGVVIHNDAGSNGANTAFYSNWLPNHNPENGFAHVYIASDGRLQASDFSNQAWHCANSYGNKNYASWEVCQSEGDLVQFLTNEQKVFDDVAKYMKEWGLKPNKDTVKLHRELSATSCPRRSVEVHGGTLESCRAYFIDELNKRLTGQNTYNNKITGEKTMFKFALNNATYFFNGNEIVLLTNGNQLKTIDKLFKPQAITLTEGQYKDLKAIYGQKSAK